MLAVAEQTEANDSTLLSFGQVLKAERQRQGKSTRELAKLVGISGSYISLIENGQRPNVGFEVIKNYANALGLDFLDLLIQAKISKSLSPDQQTRVADKLEELRQALDELDESTNS